MENLLDINGVAMTRKEWKRMQHDCPHDKFTHPGVELMDGSRMSICDRCKLIQLEPVAKMREGEDYAD